VETTNNQASHWAFFFSLLLIIRHIHYKVAKINLSALPPTQEHAGQIFMRFDIGGFCLNLSTHSTFG
jgi:hypothetical protein